MLSVSDSRRIFSCIIFLMSYKAIRCVKSILELATKENLTAKPSKIVAGQEPEKTNELLQAIAVGIQNKVDSKRAIEEWRRGQEAKGQSKPIKNAKDEKKKKVSDKIKNDKKEVKKVKSPPESIKRHEEKADVMKTLVIEEDEEKKTRVDSGIADDTGIQEEQPQHEKLSELKTEIVENSLGTPPVPSLEEVKTPPVSSEAQVDSLKAVSNVEDEKQQLIDAIDVEAERRKVIGKPLQKKASTESAAETAPSKPKDEAKPKNGKQSAERARPDRAPAEPTKVPETRPLIRPRTSLRPPSVRPASARPGAPRKRDRNIEVVLQPDETTRLGDINVKVEQFNAALRDDEENLIIIEDGPEMDGIAELQPRDEQPMVDPTADEDHGHLVKQILETQKGLTGLETDRPSSAGQLKGTQNHQQLNELRDQIQKLTKSIQPLGRFMDFLLEDVDSMQREYEMWRERGRAARQKLARERNSSDYSVQSLRNQSEDLTAQVTEHRDLIDVVKCNILQNDEKIQKLFANI